MKDRGNQTLRFFDRYLGIPLVFTLGLFRLRKRNRPEEIKSIGILATAAIGDTILISALIKDIRQANPQTEITIFCGKSNKAIAEISCPQNSLIEIPVGNPHKSMKIIRSAGIFDIWIDTGPWPRINSILSFFSRSKYKIGYKTSKQFRHYTYDKAVPHGNDCHEMDNLRALASELSISSKIIPDLDFLFPQAERKNYLVIHMYPGGFLSHYKEWSESNWISLIDRLTDMNWDIYITGAPADKKRAEELISQCKNPLNITLWAGKCSLWETGLILRESKAVISVNTGIMHFAAALSVPLVALHGPTSSLRWGPLSRSSISLNADTPSSGCLDLGFEYDKKDRNSMDTISVNTVYNALEKALDFNQE